MAEKKKTDRRIRKTRNQLKKGLIHLMAQKPLNEITVQELVDEVDINRSTFYLHYTDIYDMLEQIEEEFFDTLEQILDHFELPEGDLAKASSLQNTGLLASIFQTLQQNSELCQVLFSENGDISFPRRIIYSLREELVQRLEGSFHIYLNTRTEYLFEYCLYGTIGLISHWMQNGMKESPEMMGNLTYEFFLSNLNEILEIESRQNAEAGEMPETSNAPSAPPVKSHYVV